MICVGYTSQTLLYHLLGLLVDRDPSFLHQKTELHTWDQLVPSNKHKTDLMTDEYANRDYHHLHIVDTKNDQQ